MQKRRHWVCIGSVAMGTWSNPCIEKDREGLASFFNFYNTMKNEADRNGIKDSNFLAGERVK